MSEQTEAIKERLDIADVVGEYVPLKPAGQYLKGLCPFHQEKTPSFTVSRNRGTWHCFGCNSGGDVFSFIQQIEGLDFPATLKMLAERAGVELPKFSSPASTNHRQRLFDVLATAARFYQAVLQQKAGDQAREYLAKRGVTAETVKEFELGYAPMAWDSVQKALLRKGYTIQDLREVGLVSVNDRGKAYDRFRGRIMYPIADVQGRIVAFGGRIVPWHEKGDEGKYVNSPETALYEKRRVVYNLNRAKQALRHNQPCIVVEGYMDVIMLEQAGVHNVVASSGTAFTEDQIKQIARFTKTLHFSFDADSAGWKATLSATTAALTAGMRVATVAIPPGKGKDAADLVLAEGAAAAEYFSHTQSLTTLLLQQLKAGIGSATQEEQLQALLPFVARVANPIQQGEMIKEIEATLHVPETNIRTQLAKIPAAAAVVSTLADSSSATSSRFARSVRLEYEFLGFIMHSPQVRSELFLEAKPEFFIDARAQKLYIQLQDMLAHIPEFVSMPASAVVSALPADSQSFAEGLLAITEEATELSSNSPLEEARFLLRAMQKDSLQQRLQTLQQSLSGDDEQARQAALQQFQAVTEELAKISNQV
jgi:DNA primase